jgi:hypothetical protein
MYILYNLYSMLVLPAFDKPSRSILNYLFLLNSFDHIRVNIIPINFIYILYKYIIMINIILEIFI